ncbi:MAG: glycosyltransferase family 39 protein [Acidilobaceae archaeon]|nr:glycosyltransferase family 39 protein [Acidilobaceae archaeon]MDW7974274.1 glycosyltransferase family 39 protein [Sulfolobales archaeon]
MYRLTLLYYLLTASIALLSSLYIVWEAYSLASSYREEYVTDEIYYVDTARRLLERVFGVDVEGRYSNRTREDYFNLEHPPLGKYVIAASMALCGDVPMCWRMPGIIAGGLMPLVLYAAYATTRHPLGPAAGALAALSLAADPIVSATASVAMLDIQLSFLTALSIAFAVRGLYGLSLLSGALSLNVKISGFGTFMGSIMNLYRVEGRRERIRLMALGTLAALSLSLLLHAPLMAYFGPGEIARETLEAVKWHTSSRPEGPPSSSPSGWLFNVAPFPFSYDPRPVLAEVNTAIHLLALSFSVFAVLNHVFSPSHPYRLSAPLFYAAITVAYWAVFIAGNRTLYSFYAVQLSPAAAGAVAELMLLLWDGRGLGDEGHNSSDRAL